ncbi:hypothetical protein D8674_013562 [Pyrus ussuriensis x Pyrus communis]|uniref:Uncharacterized protein n=1 Tax=Pyrus ussuriensis x Pyrus communis TaxID=2448454 RepID=A0A5N5GSP6_9ROSA|nr:hypothetical protein D8674_013562 [Pyrus ussuriensis x Pyrus communis]
MVMDLWCSPEGMASCGGRGLGSRLDREEEEVCEKVRGKKRECRESGGHRQACKYLPHVKIPIYPCLSEIYKILGQVVTSIGPHKGMRVVEGLYIVELKGSSYVRDRSMPCHLILATLK